MDQMYPTLHPITGELIGLALETIIDQGATATQRLEAWTEDGWMVFENGKVLEEGINPYGRIPAVIFRAEDGGDLWWGTSRAMKLVTPNRDINEMYTDLRTLTREQSASLLVITAVDGEEGEDTLAVIGANKYVTLPEGSDAKYIRPDAPIDDIMTAINEFMTQALRDGAIIEVTKEGKTPESGFGMTIRKTPEQNVMAHKREAYADADAELQEMAILVDEVAKAGAPRRLAPDFKVMTVFVDDHLLPQTSDEKHKEQMARQIELDMNVVSPVDLIQEKYKITRAEAERRYLENMQLNAAGSNEGESSQGVV